MKIKAGMIYALLLSNNKNSKISKPKEILVAKKSYKNKSPAVSRPYSSQPEVLQRNSSDHALRLITCFHFS